ncbi:succinylglutamate desuccinylase/aspartoacylase family protein, partial [Candidatus Bipolaricaulota bacterium]|nr:succinylglutamate desuccinylase/aspartoacylase family protein [Candidatus Bipolaricaulota bacterium]
TYFQGTSSGVAKDRGIRAVTIELGGGLIDQRPYVKRGVDGVLNMLRCLGVIDGEVVPPPEQVVVERIIMLHPNHGGWLVTEAPALGENIQGGDVLARVVNPYTFEELEVIRNPIPKGVMILSHLTTDLVDPGYTGYMIGDLEPDTSVPDEKACS